jgi:hypothetical protein
MKLKTVAYLELSQIVLLFAIAGDAIFPGEHRCWAGINF